MKSQKKPSNWYHKFPLFKEDPVTLDVKRRFIYFLKILRL